jgi:hypothetical protein
MSLTILLNQKQAQAQGAGAIQQPVVTEWVDFTPNWTNISAITLGNARYRRVGSSMEVIIRASAVTSSGQIDLDVPDGFTPVENGFEILGSLYVDGTIGSQGGGVSAFAYQNSGVISFYINGGRVGATSRELSSDVINIQLSIPIAEWSESELVSTLPKNKFVQFDYADVTTTITRNHQISGIEAGAFYRVHIMADVNKLNTTANRYGRFLVYNSISTASSALQLVRLAIDNNVSVTSVMDVSAGVSSGVFQAAENGLYVRFDTFEVNIRNPKLIIEKVENYELTTSITTD